MRFLLCVLFLGGLAALPAAAQAPRSFDEVFPGLPPAARAAAFSREGHFRTFSRIASPGDGFGRDMLALQSGLDRGITRAVLEMEPTVLVESILVIPGGSGGRPLLDVYNALARIRDLEGRTFDSYRRGIIPLFEEATRVDAGRRNAPMPDPAPAASVPVSETVYMRLRDANFGNTFYRADMSLEGNGLRYVMTNNRNITLLMVPVIREGGFIAQMYFEPIAEGILVHSLAGVDVSGFVYSRIHMPSAISKRLAVIIEWAVDGITANRRAAGVDVTCVFC